MSENLTKTGISLLVCSAVRPSSRARLLSKASPSTWKHCADMAAKMGRFFEAAEIYDAAGCNNSAAYCNFKIGRHTHAKRCMMGQTMATNS